MPDSTRTRQDLRKALERIERTTELRIRATVDTDRIRTELRAAARDTTVDLRLDTTAALRQFVLVWRAFRQYAARNPIPLEFDVNRAQAEAQLATVLRDRSITVTARTRGTGIAFLDRLLASARRNPFVRVTAGLAGLARTTALTATVLAGLSAALLSTVQLTGGLVLALGQASGVVALLPALGLAAAAALGTLALGFTGLADAGGAAGRVRETVKGLADELQSLRRAVQDNLFADLATPIRDLVQGWLPTLSTGLGGVAAQLNGLARGVLGVLSSQQSLADGALGLQNTSALFAGLAAAAPQLTAAFRDLAVVGSGFFPEFGAGIASASTAFASFIAQARADGSLQTFMQASIDAVQTFGRVLLNVGQSFGAIFSAANVSGSGFLSGLEDITNAFLNVVSSPGAQAGLTAFFSGAQAGLDTFLGALSDTLPGVLAVVGPLLGTLTESVGSVLGSMVRALAPVVELLAPVLEQLASTLGSSLTGLFSALAPSLQAVAGSLIPVVQTLGETLAPMLAEAAPVLGEIATTAAALFAKLAVGALPVVGDLFIALLPAVQALLPVIADLVTELVDALLPVLPDIVAAVVAAVPVVVDLLRILGEFAPVIGVLVGAFAGVVGALLRFFTSSEMARTSLLAVHAGAQVVIGYLQREIGRTTMIFRNFGTIVSTAMRDLRTVALAVWSTIAAFIAEKVSQVVATGQRIVAFKDRVLQGFSQVQSGVTSRLGQVVELVRGLPGRIVSALGNLGSMLYNAGRELIAGLVSGITSRLASVRSAMSNVASTIKGFLPGSPVKTGPLRSWNNGGAGIRLNDLLARGLRNTTAVDKAMNALAARISTPTLTGSINTGAATAGATGGRPLMEVRQMNVRDEAEAARQLMTRMGDAARLAGLSSIAGLAG